MSSEDPNKKSDVVIKAIVDDRDAIGKLTKLGKAIVSAKNAAEAEISKADAERERDRAAKRAKRAAAAKQAYNDERKLASDHSNFLIKDAAKANEERRKQTEAYRKQQIKVIEKFNTEEVTVTQAHNKFMIDDFVRSGETRNKRLQTLLSAQARIMENAQKAEETRRQRAMEKEARDNERMAKRQGSAATENLGMTPFRAGLTSFGFGMMGSQMPGANIASSLSLGYGFGGAAGLVGGAAALGVSSAISGVKQLISLYVDLAKQMLEVSNQMGDARLQSSFDRMQNFINLTVATGASGTMGRLTKQADEFYQVLRSNESGLIHTTEIFGTLVEHVVDAAKSFAMLITMSNSGDEAFKKIMNAIDQINIKLTQSIDRTKWLIDHPIGGLATGVRKFFWVTPDEAKTNRDLFLDWHQKPVATAPPPDRTYASTRERMFPTGPPPAGMGEEYYDWLDRLDKAKVRADKKSDTQEGKDERAAQQLDEARKANEQKRIELDLLTQKLQLTQDINLAELHYDLIQVKTIKDLEAVNALKEKVAALEVDEKTRQATEAGINVTEVEARVRAGTATPIDLEQAKSKYMDFTTARIAAENLLNGVIINNIKSEAQFAADKQIRDFDNPSTFPVDPTEIGDPQGRWSTLGGANDWILKNFKYATKAEQLKRAATNISSTMSGIQSQTSLAQDIYNKNPTQQNMESVKRSQAYQLSYARSLAQVNKLLLEQAQRELAVAVARDTAEGTAESGEERDAKLKALDDINQKITENDELMTKLEPHIRTIGEAFRNSFDMATARIQAFKGVLGETTSNMGSLLRAVKDLGKIKDKEGNEAGGIVSGLKAGFGGLGGVMGGIGGIFTGHRKSKTDIEGNVHEQSLFGGLDLGGLVQGLSAAGGIASAASTLIQGIGKLLSRGADKIRNTIAKEVDKSIANLESGAWDYPGTIDYLQRQRSEAIRGLSGRRGGQAALDQLLPEIDKNLADVLAKQKDIIDNFSTELSFLDISDEKQGIIKNWDEVNAKVAEFINAAGKSEDSFAKAFAFIDKSAAKMQADVRKDMEDARKAFYESAENERGEIISQEQQAADQIAEIEKTLQDTRTKLGKERLKMEKDNAKAIKDDAENILNLQNAILDIQDQLQKDITTIQNEGIAERQKTTEADKAQRIADAQDAAEKQEEDILKQIALIGEQAAARQEAFDESMAQMDEEEAAAQLAHDNAIARINNELERDRAAYLERIAMNEALLQQITDVVDEEGRHVANLELTWKNSLQARADDYQTYLNTISQMNADFAQQESMKYSSNQTVMDVGGISLSFAASTAATPYQIQTAVKNALDDVASRTPF